MLQLALLSTVLRIECLVPVKVSVSKTANPNKVFFSLNPCVVIRYLQCFIFCKCFLLEFPCTYVITKLFVVAQGTEEIVHEKNVSCYFKI